MINRPMGTQPQLFYLHHCSRISGARNIKEEGQKDCESWKVRKSARKEPVGETVVQTSPEHANIEGGNFMGSHP